MAEQEKGGEVEMVRMQTRVSQDLQRRAKATAALRGVTIEAWIASLIEAAAVKETDQSA